MEIPTTIHYIWLGGPKTPLVEETIKTWRKRASNFKIVEWNEEKLEPLMKNNTFYKSALQQKKYAYAADCARIEILYKYGGIYLDTDEYLLKDPSPLLKNREFAVCFQDPKSEIVSMGFLATIPKQRFIREASKFYSNLKLDNSIKPNSETLGPMFFDELRLEHSDITQERDNGKVVFYEKRLLYQPSFRSYAIHVGLKAWGQHNLRDKLRISIRRHVKNRFTAGIFDMFSRVTNKIIIRK